MRKIFEAIVERWFSEITSKRIRQGRTFVCTKSAGQILQSLRKVTGD